MKEIYHHKYSLFLLEKYIGGWGSEFTQKCFEYLETFDSLEEAEDNQKHMELKTIILTSY